MSQKLPPLGKIVEYLLTVSLPFIFIAQGIPIHRKIPITLLCTFLATIPLKAESKLYPHKNEYE